jgi:hypothetical protein
MLFSPCAERNHRAAKGPLRLRRTTAFSWSQFPLWVDCFQPETSVFDLTHERWTP